MTFTFDNLPTGDAMSAAMAGRAALSARTTNLFAAPRAARPLGTALFSRTIPAPSCPARKPERRARRSVLSTTGFSAARLVDLSSMADRIAECGHERGFDRAICEVGHLDRPFLHLGRCIDISDGEIANQSAELLEL